MFGGSALAMNKGMVTKTSDRKPAISSHSGVKKQTITVPVSASKSP